MHWNHLKCTKLTKNKFKALSLSDEDFYCQICISEILPFMSLTNLKFYKMLNNVNHNINTVSYLCLVCQNKCANSIQLKKLQPIQCNSCHHWVHLICSGLSEQKSKYADTVMQKYFCNRCLTDFLPFHTLSNVELLKLSYNSLHNENKSLVGLTHPQYIDLDNLKSDSITLLFINIRSLNCNFDKLHELISHFHKCPSIISISETWLLETKYFTHTLPGYNFIHSKSFSKCGGVAMFISNKLSYNVTEDYNLNINGCEDLWVKVTLPNKSVITIGNVYRHPNYKFDQFENNLLSTFQKLNYKGQKFLAGGDFNIDVSKQIPSINNYLDNILSSGCTQEVMVPTRYSNYHRSASVLDHIYTNMSSCELNTSVLLEDVSDHLPVLASLTNVKLPKSPTYKVLTQDFSSFDSDNFLYSLKKNLLSLNLQSVGANQSWKLFETVFSETVFTHAPLRPMSRREKKLSVKPWITKGITKSSKKLKNMYKKCMRSSPPKLSSEYRLYRNTLTRVKQLSKKKYYQKTISESASDNKKLWRNINNIINFKNSKCTSIEYIKDNEGKTVDDHETISNLMNDNFASLVDNLILNNQCDSTGTKISTLSQADRLQESFFLKPFSVQDIIMAINSMNICKSSKSDLPKIKFLKLSVNIISPFITDIFNKCILEGVFPDSLKSAEVIPIHKSGSKHDINNYRPISILSPFSKLFESHLCKCLTDFFDKHDILYRKQFGFRNGRSTDLAVLETINELAINMDKKLVTCSIFLDLAKAFNTVNHEILLLKLEKYGVRGSPLCILKSYLKSRSQRTKVGCSISSEVILDTGVPQGSCLGPLLFLVYINDLHLHTAFKVCLFADDACLSLSNVDPYKLENNVNNELVNVATWLQNNKLFLNYKKTNYLIFSKRKRKFKLNIKINNYSLEEKQNTMYLGVIIDNKLNWQPHLCNLKNTLAKGCYALSKLRKFVDIDVLKKVYYSLIYSKLQYCISSWGGCSDTALDTIFKLQKRAVRFICNKSYSEPTHPLFSSQKMLKLEDVYKLKICTLMHSFFKNQLYCDVLMKNLSECHTYLTRLSKSQNCFVPSVRTNLGKYSFQYIGPKLWQNVPFEFKNCSTESFKSKYKKYLIDLYSSI